MRFLIIPDLHGKPWWKQAIAQAGDVDYIVFLGDYLDCWKTDGWTNAHMLENLEEIIGLAKSDPRVKLLLGNHEVHYLWKEVFGRYPGFRSSLYYKASGMLMSAYGRQMGLHFALRSSTGQNYLFSHAGLHPTWLSEVSTRGVHELGWEPCGVDGSDVVTWADTYLPILHLTRLHTILDRSSGWRGGTNQAGSILWADRREYSEQHSIPNLIQIVGHTPDHMVKGVVYPNKGGLLHTDCLDTVKMFAVLDTSKEWEDPLWLTTFTL